MVGGENGQPTWRTAIRQDVDEAIQQSLTWRQFVAALQVKGYELRFNRKYPVLRPLRKKSALFDSKRWASGTRQKQSRRASCIHKAPTLMWKIHQQSNMAVCAAGKAPSQAGRAAGTVLSLPVRIGRAAPQAASPQLCGAAGCLQVRPAHPADGVPIQAQH